MKTFYFTAITTAILFICSNGILAQTVKADTPEKVEYYKVSEVRIYISNQSDIMELRKQGLGFENMKLNDKSFDVMLDSYQISILKNTGYSYEILIDDVTKDYLQRTKESRELMQTKKATMTSGFGLGSMGGYYTFKEVVAQLDSMRSKYPNLITIKDSIGKSIEGRAIWAVKISDNPDIKENEPEIFYNALTHAREQQGMMAVLYFMFYLLENYGTDPEVTYLVNNRELYFVPVINPDGYTYNEQMSPNGGGMWRRNRRDYGGGIFGVDLNRNYGFKWGFDNSGSDANKGDFNYRGTAPFSEPETQVVRKFCIAHNFSICNSFHVPLKCIFSPWSYKHEQSPDSVIFNHLIELSTAINGFRNGAYIPAYEVPPANGEVNDWMYGETVEKKPIFGLVTEVSNSTDGFWPKPEKIIPLSEENLYLSMVSAWGPGIIENPPFIMDGNINLAYCKPNTDALKFNAVEQNPDNHTSKVYAQILNSTDGIVSETLLTQTDSAFNGTLSFGESDENFYTVRYRQNGTDMPSNLYYADAGKLKFTTAGPVVLDSIVYKKQSTYFTFKPYLKNTGKILQINNLTFNVSSNDAWVKSISPAKIISSNLTPGQIKNSQPFSVGYDAATFPNYFNLKFTFSSDGYVYWTDSVKALITGIENDLQQNAFNLEQNYPNPFNSVTTITWQLAHSNRATLKVFDIVGRTVATLVDGQRPQGKYETRFDTATLPKGVYFYQLKAGEFSQTRKMILLK